MVSRSDETLKYVQFLARRLDIQNVRAVVLAILFDLGFKTSSDGFAYLRSCIELQCTRSLVKVSKDVYPVVSQIYNAGEDGRNVDQAIRRAIRYAWKYGDREIWKICFPKCVKWGKAPSAKEFIADMCAIVELMQGCKEVGYEEIG